jgi:hypothetical protein
LIFTVASLLQKQTSFESGERFRRTNRDTGPRAFRLAFFIFHPIIPASLKLKYPDCPLMG